MRPMVLPETGQEEERSPGATLTDDEIKAKLKAGDIKKEDLSHQQAELYREFVRLHRLARKMGDI